MAETRPYKVLVLDNDELTGSYMIVFAMLQILGQLVKPGSAFCSMVQSSLELQRLPHTVNDAEAFILKSFGRTTGLLACPNGLCRPDMQQFLLYAIELRSQKLIDSIVLYTAASDGKAGIALDLFMTNMLAASIGVDPDTLFDDFITRDKQLIDAPNFEKTFNTPAFRKQRYGNDDPNLKISLVPARTMYEKWFPNVPREMLATLPNMALRKSMVYVRTRFALKRNLDPLAQIPVQILMFDDQPQGITELWIANVSAKRIGDYRPVESATKTVGVPAYFFTPTLDQAVGLWYHCLINLSMELRNPSIGGMLTTLPVQTDTMGEVSMLDYVRSVFASFLNRAPRSTKNDRAVFDTMLPSLKTFVGDAATSIPLPPVPSSPYEWFEASNVETAHALLNVTGVDETQSLFGGHVQVLETSFDLRNMLYDSLALK